MHPGTLKKRAADILANFDRPGASNGPLELINGRLRWALANRTNYIARSLLETGASCSRAMALRFLMPIADHTFEPVMISEIFVGNHQQISPVEHGEIPIPRTAGCKCVSKSLDASQTSDTLIVTDCRGRI